MFNFKTKLHLACSRDDFRESMQHIKFANGYMYATNAHVLIKQSLSLHTEESELPDIDGYIHADTFKELQKAETVVFEDGHFICYNKRRTVKTKYELINKDEFAFPNVDQLVMNAKGDSFESLPQIKLDLKLLEILQNCLINPNSVEFNFAGANKAIFLRSRSKDNSVPLDWNEECALIMPLM